MKPLSKLKEELDQLLTDCGVHWRHRPLATKLLDRACLAGKKEGEKEFEIPDDMEDFDLDGDRIPIRKPR
jgi:hypothetical protein